MWLACFLILIATLLWQVWVAGPRRALGVTVVLSILVPTWVVFKLGGFPIQMRLATGVIGLAVYCLHPNSTIHWRIGIIDLLALAFFGVHLVSDGCNDGFRLGVPLRAYSEWAVPFLSGRLALQTIDDVRDLLPFVLVVSAILATISMLESVVGVNVLELAFGDRPLDQIPRHFSRFNLMRAYGPTMDPIYFGALQGMLFSWALYAASRAQRGVGPRWWRWTPWVSGMGVFFTMSQAPLLAIGIILYVTAVITKPVYRKILWVLVFLMIVAGVIGWQSILDALNRWGGELKDKGNIPTIVIDGQEQVYSATLTRVYLFDIYGSAMQRAGWLGFGTARTTNFPVDVPISPQHAKTVEQLPRIDNAYILLTLRFGYLGVAAFALLGIASVIGYVRMLDRPFARGIIFCAATAGSLVAIMLLLLTVWMAHDFGFWYLWTIGAASGLTCRRDPEYDDLSRGNDFRGNDL